MDLIDHTKEYIENLIKQDCPILCELKEQAKKMHIPIISDQTAALLSFMVSVKDPARILEIGTAIGYSSIIMAKNTNDGCLIDTVDRNIRIINTARENIEKAGYSKRINVIAADAMDVFKNLEKKYDFIFLDGSKSKYIDFLPYCMKLLNEEGIIFSDNVLFRGLITGEKKVEHRQRTISVKMNEYLNKICNDRRLKAVVLPVGDGAAIVYKKGIDK